MQTSTIQPVRENDLLTRLTLLVSQSFFLGLMLGLMIVAAIALLLSIYGSDTLPYVYITVAILGALSFYGFAEVQRRWSLVQVSSVSILIIISFLAFAWTGLAFIGWNWLAFAAMVAFPLIMQVGFVILGSQAGRLLDVRQIKRHFPRIIGGFVVGFIVAGALVTPIQIGFGNTESLLLAAAVSGGLMLSMLLLTNGRYRALLAQSSPDGQAVDPPPLRRLLTKRFVLLIFAYQMLTAMVIQLMDFMVLSATGARFTNSDELALFMGNLTVVINVTDLLFLALLAGLLISRLGLRFGLIAKSAVNILFLASVIAAGFITGQETALFFWLVIIARIFDIIFTDGTTRPSTNATYQALPAHERVAVQTGVEGIGAPVALGLAGVLLLIFEALGGINLVTVAVVALLLAFLLFAVALLVFRSYGRNLLRTMRRRALDPGQLSLEDTGLAVTQRLLSSKQLSDVRLGLDVLQGTGHPSLSEELLKLSGS
ncbi:MAG: hypothetical protein R3293_20420, partial [Candidatus Promineifilaceae bacterium]|nr:hypothetical protein [Candidatus Promineifilaceae bacterium]